MRDKSVLHNICLRLLLQDMDSVNIDNQHYVTVQVYLYEGKVCAAKLMRNNSQAIGCKYTASLPVSFSKDRPQLAHCKVNFTPNF